MELCGTQYTSKHKILGETLEIEMNVWFFVIRGLFFNVEMEQTYIQAYSTVEKPQVE